MDSVFYVLSGVCLGCFILRTAFNILKYRKHRWAENKMVYRGILVIMFVLWASWFQMNFFDPLIIHIPNLIRYFGLGVFIAGVVLFLLSHLQLKGFEDKGFLVRKGIYSKIRNPMYLGFILWVFGFPLFMQAFMTFLSGGIWVAFFVGWQRLEEMELEKKYPEYKEYIKSTWF